jgi:integrase
MTPTTKRQVPTGLRARHSRSCGAPDARCSCSPSWEAWACDRRTGRKIRKTFPTQAAAKAWRAEATTAVRKGSMRAAPSITLREAAAAWLAGARDGSIRNRSGDVYKPSALRGYAASLERHVLPDLGGAKLGDISRTDVQDLAERLLATGADPSTIRNAIMPLRVIVRRAVSRGEVAVNPCTGLELPSVRGKRDRIASPGEAAELIAALPEGDRAVWATATYGGLRRGELMELRWGDVDLAAGVIRVGRSWDPKEREVVETKSRAGRRRCRSPRSCATTSSSTSCARAGARGWSSAATASAGSITQASPVARRGPGLPKRYGGARTIRMRGHSSRSACTSADTPSPR